MALWMFHAVETVALRNQKDECEFSRNIFIQWDIFLFSEDGNGYGKAWKLYSKNITGDKHFTKWSVFYWEMLVSHTLYFANICLTTTLPHLSSILLTIFI